MAAGNGFLATSPDTRYGDTEGGFDAGLLRGERRMQGLFGRLDEAGGDLDEFKEKVQGAKMPPGTPDQTASQVATMRSVT